GGTPQPHRPGRRRPGRARGARATGARPRDLAHPPRPADRGLAARRICGHHRAHPPAAVAGGARPADRHREQGRRVRLDRRRRRRAGRGGRLHVAARLRHHGHQRNGHAPPLQGDGGLRPGVAGGHRPALHGGAQGHAVPHLQGRGGGRQAQPGRPQLRHLRRRRPRARGDHPVAAAGRLPAVPRALPRRRPGGAGRHGGPRAAVHVERRRHQPAHQGGHAAPARRHHPRRNAARPRRAELRPAGLRRLRSADLVGAAGPRARAGADRAADARSPVRRAGRPRGEGEGRGAGRRRRRLHAGGVRPVHPGRDREVGQGDPRQQHPRRQL
ncbi:MAG: BUG/TctC family periplasmic protein, partial [uncultured Acetobacteraceae bacterium]